MKVFYEYKNGIRKSISPVGAINIITMIKLFVAQG